MQKSLRIKIKLWMLIQKQRREKKWKIQQENRWGKKLLQLIFIVIYYRKGICRKYIYICTCNEIHATELQKQKQRKTQSPAQPPAQVLAVKTHKVSGQMSKE